MTFVVQTQGILSHNTFQTMPTSMWLVQWFGGFWRRQRHKH